MIELQKQFQPKERNICSACGKDVGVSKLVVAGNVNICFECADLAKQLADKKRKEMAFKQVRELGDFLEGIEGGTSMYEIAEKIYDAGYRKVE
ncbi:ClpX C4-type zinc finger protein [Providencia alcalifaciens]|uniref:ClpX C4-type zinc finger protein n=1 Tax=Providencia alcalifaciens TaxID=126385 RepID=UPI003D27F408